MSYGRPFGSAPTLRPTPAGGLGAYAQATAKTAGPAEVVKMAYERILIACDRSRIAVSDRRGGWMETFHDETTRAQAILGELIGMLALQHDSEDVRGLSEQLAELYGFSIDQLVKANLHKDAKPLGVVESVIAPLRDAWVEGVCAR